jgi:hypothetical protein
LDAFGKVSMLLLEVINGRAALDRPELASKAIRILSVLADSSIKNLKHIEAGRNQQHSLLALKLKPGPIPSENLHPVEPFAPLKPILCTMAYALRTHKQDATLLNEALSMIVKLKEIALLSPPADVDQRSPNLLYPWQRLLADAEKHGELEAANTMLKRAVDDTDVANDRMRCTGLTPDQLTGDTFWLTPRLREKAASTHLAAAELVGDAIACRWRNGEPARYARKYGDTSELSTRDQLRKEKADSEQLNRGQQKRGSAAGMQGSPDTQKENVAQAKDRSKKGSKPGAKAKAKHEPHRKGSDQSIKKPKEKENVDPPEWTRALGFGTYDEEDFARLWREPLQASIQRALNMAPVHLQKAEKMKFASLASLEHQDGQSEEQLGEGETAPKLFSSSSSTVNIQVIESTEGLLKTKVVLPSLDDSQYHAAEKKLKALIAGPAADSEVSAEVSKHMKKNSYLMPAFGIQVHFKKGHGHRCDFADTIAAAGGS